MAAASETIQIIAKLTPLADVLALIERDVMPVTPSTRDLGAARGRTLAADVAAAARPAAPLALIDGWAVRADETFDAGGYAPALLAHSPRRVDAGQILPEGSDSVAPLDAVKVNQNGAEALVAITPGDGVLHAGDDCDPAVPLRRQGERMRGVDAAAIAAAGVARVSVREPRLRVVPLRESSIVTATARMIADDIERLGGTAQFGGTGQDLGAALAAADTDAVIALGGTGTGRDDTSVRKLTQEGRLAVHGMALSPGETAALGFVGHRPVLLLPGRLDAALAVWLVAGRRILERLAATDTRRAQEPTEVLTLSRKVTSTVGLAELVPVRRSGDTVEPMATKYLPFSALARSDGWILVPADREGYSAGSPVSVRRWP